jgi:hypothetical protein
LFPDSGRSSSSGLKRLQGEPWVKHNRVIDELLKRETVGLPSFEVEWEKDRGSALFLKDSWIDPELQR